MDTHKVSLIQQVPLFASLRANEIQYLAEILHESEAPAHTLLFQEGEPGGCFYLILAGQIEVIKALGTADELVVGVRGAGEFFGEMSLLDPDGLRTASVRARTPLRLLEMAQVDFDALLQQQPALACAMVRVLSLRLREADDKTISELHQKNRQLAQAYQELQAAQAQIIEKEKLEHELQTARWIQQSILPRTLPRLPGFDFGARLEPARAVGGDLFDFIPLGRDRVGVVIGDVSDKGVPAAIFMALTYSLLRAEAGRSASPGKVLQRVNRHLVGMNKAGMFVTVLYGILDGPERVFSYARAGHELPLLLDAGGVVRLPDHARGELLGLFDAPELDEQTVALPAGETLLLYTDGATDLTNPADIPFGRERLQAAAQAGLGGTAQALCDQVWRALSEYQRASAQADDVALVAIQAQGREPCAVHNARRRTPNKPGSA